jgi:hypothetical protein
VILADRIEVAHSLDVPAVATIAAVGNNDVVKGLFFRTSARQSNANHYYSVY